MRIWVRRWLLTATLLLGGAESSQAADSLTPKQMETATAWAANNAMFVLYHEVAHLLVDQLRLPVLGKEEDAADAMASYTLLERNTHESDVAIADAAYGWLLSAGWYGEDFDDSDFYNPHSLDRQRAFQIVCFMVGSDASSFRKIADEYNIDRDRQETCAYDYDLLKRSLEGVLGTHWRRNTKGVDVEITYNTVSGNLKPAADAFRESGVFEQVAETLNANYALRSKVNFRAQRCGEPNAFYDPSSVEVIFCYELMDDFIAMISEDMPDEDGVELTVPNPSGLGRAGTSVDGF